jgi:hypothetical protein
LTSHTELHSQGPTPRSSPLSAADIPATAFITDDIQSEFRRLKSVGVTFRFEPTSMGPITTAFFEDTCGNLINLVQPTD